MKILEGRPANKFSDKKYGHEYSYAIFKVVSYPLSNQGQDCVCWLYRGL